MSPLCTSRGDASVLKHNTDRLGNNSLLSNKLDSNRTSNITQNSMNTDKVLELGREKVIKNIEHQMEHYSCKEVPVKNKKVGFL